MKIAFTSSNGIFIDTGFEKAKSFYVVDFEGNLIISIKRRKINKTKNRKIKFSNFENHYELIKDCLIVCTKKIDVTTKLRLDNLGIRVLVIDGKIKEALNILNVI